MTGDRMTPITLEIDVNAPRGVVDALLFHIAEQPKRFRITAPGSPLGEVEIVAARRANRWRLLKGIVERQLESRRESLESAVAFLRRRLDEAEAFGITGYDEHRAAVEILEDIQEWMEALETEDNRVD